MAALDARTTALPLTVALTVIAALMVALHPSPAHAATNTLTLNVVSARTEPRAFGGVGVTQGDPVSSYQFIINVDNTGTTDTRTPTGPCSPSDTNYPNSCGWTSISEIFEASPIYFQGDQTDLAAGLDLPDGRYLISVLADGYRLDGEHFTVPFEGTGEVTVGLQPNPLPDSTARAQVFSDVAPTNGTFDVGDQPLVGFDGHVFDTLGEISTDVYGNPLCTTYVGEDPDTHEIPLAALDADMLPVVDALGGQCLSDANGLLTIPHLGTNRYTLAVTPPDGQRWIQTTTLEGAHDWDTWVMEGSTGFDTEFARAGEPVPQPLFGFAPPTKNGQPLDSTASGHIKGHVVGIKTYTPPKGGSFNFWGGNTGTRIDHPIRRPWLSLADLDNGDQAVWIGRGNVDGSFDIAGVPDGNYSLSWWDQPQNYNLNFINVTVKNGRTVRMRALPLNGWWTVYDGYVFNDKNRNGRKDAGEGGVPNFVLTLRKPDNSLMDRGQTTAVTDANGYYKFISGYPTGSWLVMEAYSDSFFTTGVTYQADNQPEPTTVKGAGVDVSVLPIIGLSGQMDWGVHAYDPSGSNGIDPRNGGIVGSVSYDTTRNELDPQYAAVEDWQPGVPNIPVELYSTVDCGTHADAPCDENGFYELAPDGSYATGQLLNTYVTESWQRPTGCTARDVDGNPLIHGVDEQVLALDQENGDECISSFIQGIQFGTYATDQGTPDANFGATVDGNYGFGDGCFGGTLLADDPANPVCQGGQFDPLPAGDYLVRLAIPNDQSGNPMYKVTSEEDINIGRGDQIIPQVPPPACAGPLHTVDVAGQGTDGYAQVVGDGGVTNPLPVGVTVPASQPVENPTFADIDGTIFEGTQQPRCETKLVELNNGKSIVPAFNLFTEVPIPSRLRGLIVDDINFSNDPKSTMFGEKSGLPFVPVGIYDFTGRLVQTLESDYNGMYDVLLPSSDHISCPTPSGMCAGMYRFVANDPGVPGALNPNFNPRYRAISTEFEALPGVQIFTDLAPTQVGLMVEQPATGALIPITCPLPDTQPQLFAVSTPYVDGSGSFSIEGTGFGATQGTGDVTLDGTALPTTSWSDTHIDVDVPADTPAGPHQLLVTRDNGRTTVNGLTFHVLGAGYSPAVREVGPGRSYATIQAALDAAFDASADDLVVVFPGTPDFANPRLNPYGAYFENLIVASPVKLQGVGPGGFQGSTYVPGSMIDASAFGGDTQLATDWYTKVGSLTWDGNQNVNDAEAIYLLASQNGTTAADRARQFTAEFKASIDGFDIRGGDQQGFPGNINDLTGLPTGLPPGIVTQGGAIFANSYVRHLQITNNVVQNNASGYGTIRIGTPDLTGPAADNHNEQVRIAHNRIVDNAGTNLAGGIGIYAGADGYQVTQNDICGNFSLEYGGGLSVYGRSPNGSIDHNRIYFNHSNDEGAGIMIAGQLPADPDALSPGSGPVDIDSNLIEANLANDDGGGIRFLMAGGNGGTDVMNVRNNMIVANVSTHEGGGIALNDTPTVRIVNNTIMNNLTTATAVTSNGAPAPAGVSSVSNSAQLQATLPAGAPTFSNPLMFNNILWDNRAGTRAGTTVSGLGLAGDTLPVDHWDVGVADLTGVLSPTSSVVQQNSADHDYADDPSNSSANPQVVDSYHVSVSFQTWRQNPAFVDATLVAFDAAWDQLGDFHLGACPGSPACNLGVATNLASGVNAPELDFDDEYRPALGGFDAGADEFGASTTPPPPPPPPPSAQDYYFSTLGNENPPGLTGPADDADVLHSTASGYARAWTAAAAGVPAGADLDGYSRIDDAHFYASFDSLVTLSQAGGGTITVRDEDVVYFDEGTWRLWFDGSMRGLGDTGEDVGSVSVVGTTLYFTMKGGQTPPGFASGDNNDIYRWNGGRSFTRVVDGSNGTYGLPSGATVDGLEFESPGHFWLSLSGASTTVPGIGAVGDEDVLEYTGTGWSLWSDGSAFGLTTAALDIDALSIGAAAVPPPHGPVTFTTVGNAAIPGVPGVGENSDIYDFDGTSFARTVEADTILIPENANVDALDQVGPGQYYLSFAGRTNLPVIGFVQDEDVVFYDNGAWSVFFDGTAAGLVAPGHDIDAVSVDGDRVFFSTRGNVKPPGVGGVGDDADIYRWDGTGFIRAWDATANGVAASEDVDGFSRTAFDHYKMSFIGPVNLPGVGVFEDEDVVSYDAGTWSLYFDATTYGLTSPGQDIDGLDIPSAP